MKIERINENQIRCTLTSVDLSARNIRLSELAYGSDKTRNLFREMIQQASIETGFDADDIPLVIEAIPLNSGSIMLIITKVEDPEELDSRFSRFTPSPEEDMEDQIPPMESEQLDGADSLMNLLNTFAASMSGADPANLDADGGAHSGLVRPAAESGQDSAVNRLSGEPGTDSTANQPAGNAGADSTLIRPAGEPGSDSTLIRPAGGQDVSGAQDRAADSDTGNASFADSALAGASGSGKPATRFYAFPDLDAAITAAKICDRAYAGKSTLYKSPAGTFLLVLHVDDAENLPFIHICNRLSDFASRQKHPEATEAFYAEHYDLIIREDALRHLAEL